MVMLASAVAAVAKLSAVHPATGETIVAVNLFSAEMVRKLSSGLRQVSRGLEERNGQRERVAPE
ncbi:MAG: hypothetical protein HC902_14475, partial [Calothrix sp. SM1_5_4]|nr:hypothetical protein [Calothrix sp. SM1_5_4]